MSSSLTKRNKEWTADPVPEGSTVNRAHEKGTEKTNNRDTEFYALYTSFSPNRDSIPDDVRRNCFGAVSGVGLFSFRDKANPFYTDDTSMYGLDANNVEEAVRRIESEGYKVEVRHDTAQFCFSPRPTIGEIVITECDSVAARGE